MIKKQRYVFTSLIAFSLGIPASISAEEGRAPGYAIPEALVPSLQATSGAYQVHLEARLNLEKNTRQLLDAIQKYLPEATKREMETIQTILHSLNNKYPENIYSLFNNKYPENVEAHDRIIALDPVPNIEALTECIEDVIQHLVEELDIVVQGSSTHLLPLLAE